MIAVGTGPDDRHDAEDRVALLVRADHLAERARQRERDHQDQVDLEPVREPVRVLEGVPRVGVEDAATVGAQHLDDLLRGGGTGVERTGAARDGVDRRQVARKLLRNTHGDQHGRGDDGDRQQQPQVQPRQVHPEVAETVGPGAHEATDQGAGDTDADGRRHEVLHREAGELGGVAEHRLTRVVLPVGVREERGRGVVGEIRLHRRHAEGEHQVILNTQDQIEQQHAGEGEGQQGAQVRRPRLVGLRVDPHDPVQDLLHPPVFGRVEQMGHVVAQRAVRHGQREDEEQGLQPARSRYGHLRTSPASRVPRSGTRPARRRRSGR